MTPHMIGTLFFALVILQASSITRAGTMEDDVDYNIMHQRSLSQSLLQKIFSYKPKPEVERCWGELEIDDDTGEKRPAISCDFIVPEHYYSTSEIKRGTCLEFNEPACDEKEVVDECGSFVESGRIRTVSYPLNDINPWNDESNHTFCARADLYQVVDSTGRQLSIAHASKELSISFTGLGNDEEYLVDMETIDSSENSSIPMGAVIGCLIGILFVIPIVAFSIAKKRHQGGTQIHEDSQTAIDDDTEVIDDGEIELL